MASGANPEARPGRRPLSALSRENRRLRARIAMLGETSAAIAREPDAEVLARIVADRVGPLVGARRAFVVLGLSTSEPPTVHPAEGSEGEPVAAFRALASTTVARKRGGDDSAFAAPIRDHQGQAMGAIEVAGRVDGGAFTPEEERLVVGLAVQAAPGFERARVFGRLHEWSRLVEMLLSFAAAVDRSRGAENLARCLVEHAATFVRADGGFVAEARRRTDDLPILRSDAYWRAGRWSPRWRSWTAGRGLPGLVLRNEFVYFTNDYADDPGAERDLADRHEIARAICIPLKDDHGRVVGAFELHRRRGRPPFTWQDASFLEALANSAAVAIENARLLGSLETQTARIRSLSAANLRRLEEEREHIARELHDETGQALIGIKLGLQALGRSIPGAFADVRAELDLLRGEAAAAASRLNDLARRLRPSTLDRLGLDAAIRQLAGDVQTRAGLNVRLAAVESSGRLPSAVELAFYRIVQESLTNIVKHSGAQSARIRLRVGPRRADLCVADDGRGFDVDAATGGLGLAGIRERVELIGGALAIRSRPGRGTILHVRLGLDGHAAS